MWSKLPGDNFFLGVLTGIITLVASYLSLRAIRLSFVEQYGNPFIFPSPRIELISILINVLFFRILVLNLKKEQTGRGVFFITVIIAMAFFFLFFKINFRLP